MKNRALLCVVGTIVGAFACGGASQTDFGDPISGSGRGGASGAGPGSGGSTGGTSVGGTSGSSQGGTGATDTGGSANGGTAGDVVAAGGTAGDLVATGGTAGDLMAAGGMAGEPMGSGGTAGDATGGTDPGTGGSANAGGSAGMATGGSAGKPGTGGSAGMPNCVDLNQQYTEALQAARVCNSNSGKDQCTELVPGSLTCGCEVFVNPANMEAVAELTRLRKQGARCMELCPAIACVAPENASCAQDADGAEGHGHCVTAIAGGPI